MQQDVASVAADEDFLLTPTAPSKYSQPRTKQGKKIPDPESHFKSFDWMK